MSLKDWERDVLNRQRNIVFPDTVLNEARFYRNVISGKARLNWLQRLGILMIAGALFIYACFGLADSFRFLLLPGKGLAHATDIIFGSAWLGVILCAIGLVVGAVFPFRPLAQKKRRRGYRQSGKA